MKQFLLGAKHERVVIFRRGNDNGMSRRAKREIGTVYLLAGRTVAMRTEIADHFAFDAVENKGRTRIGSSFCQTVMGASPETLQELGPWKLSCTLLPIAIWLVAGSWLSYFARKAAVQPLPSASIL